jgi:hypothetical protein
MLHPEGATVKSITSPPFFRLVSRAPKTATQSLPVRVTTSLFLTIAAFAQPQTAGITGTVIDAVTHRPVKGATVQVPSLNNRTPPATTGADGTFVLDHAPIGHYAVRVIDPEYPQTGIARVEVNPGEITSGVTIEMTPGAVFSGHVVDEDGDPMPNCLVQADPAAGKSKLHVTGNTDDSGEYHLRGLPAGKYLVSATCSAIPFTPRPFSSGPDPPSSSAYPRQYYSGGADARSAQAVTLGAAVVHSGVDFQMRPERVFEVSGTFSLAGSHRKGTDRALNIMLVSSDALVTHPSDLKPGAGTFTFGKVFPGSYDLIAFSIAGPESRVGAFAHIEVKDRPIEIDLDLKRGLDISGTVTLEETGTALAFNQITVQLQPAFPFGLGEFNDYVKPDGTFTLKSVLPGRWRLTAYNPKGGFVARATFGDTDVSSDTFTLDNGGGAFRIVFSDRTGTIAGTASPGENIVVRREGDDISRSGGVDSSGRFHIDNLAPGIYVIMARRPIIGFLPFDEEGSRTVTIHEGETINLEFKQP